MAWAKTNAKTPGGTTKGGWGSQHQKTTSRASQTPPTNRPLRTMRPSTRTNGTVATPRPQPRPHRIPRLLTWSAVPCLRRTMQPASRSQESTSHPALQQTTQLRRIPLVSRRFWNRADEPTCSTSLKTRPEFCMRVERTCGRCRGLRTANQHLSGTRESGALTFAVTRPGTEARAKQPQEGPCPR